MTVLTQISIISGAWLLGFSTGKELRRRSGETTIPGRIMIIKNAFDAIGYYAAHHCHITTRGQVPSILSSSYH